MPDHTNAILTRIKQDGAKLRDAVQGKRVYKRRLQTKDGWDYFSAMSLNAAQKQHADAKLADYEEVIMLACIFLEIQK